MSAKTPGKEKEVYHFAGYPSLPLEQEECTLLE